MELEEELGSLGGVDGKREGRKLSIFKGSTEEVFFCCSGEEATKVGRVLWSGVSA